MVATSIVVAATSVTHAASAGVRTPVSAIAAVSRPTPLAVSAEPIEIPGIVVTSKQPGGGLRYHEIAATTKQGYCLSTGDEPRFMTTWLLSTNAGVANADLYRLVVPKSGHPTLERTSLRIDAADVSSLRATARSSVALHEVARSPMGVVVWAYRDGADVVVVARDVESGMDGRARPEDGFEPFISNEGCSFAAMHIDARKPGAGAFGELLGTLPPPAKGKAAQPFVIDASVSRVTRDPEAMIAVRVRRAAGPRGPFD